METRKTSSHVSVIGRLGARHQSRELPSGIALTSFTVIVDRPPERKGRTGKNGKNGKNGKGTGSGGLRWTQRDLGGFDRLRDKPSIGF